MGLEALSRGASHSTFVEKNPKPLACLQDNIKALDVAKQTRVLSLDARMALARLLKEGALFDVIYLDPPYEAIHLYLEIITFLDTHPLMTNGGHLFIEEGLPSKLTLPPLTHFQKKDSRTFGRSQLHQLIYRD
jgi:16S rRNA (guanine(966)-N(2))-methyltransferase RsmD